MKTTFEQLKDARQDFRYAEIALDAARRTVETRQRELEIARKAYVEAYRVHEATLPPEERKPAVRARAEAVKALEALNFIEEKAR